MMMMTTMTMTTKRKMTTVVMTKAMATPMSLPSMATTSTRLSDAAVDVLTSSVAQWRARVVCAQLVVADHMRASAYRNLLALATRRRDLLVELACHASLLPYQARRCRRVAAAR